MVKYRAVKEKHHDPDIGTYTAWGIRGWRVDDKDRTVIDYIPDVFLSRRDAEQFASLYSRLNIAVFRPSDIEDCLEK